jgi:hypothetical protein
MAITDIFLDRRPKLAQIQLDCSVSETHPSGRRVTKYPVEVGADRSDHMQDEPDAVELEGLISNAGPNIALIPLNPTDPLGQTRRGIVAWQQLKSLKASDEPFTVVTSLAVYTRMVFAEGDSLVATRDQDNSEVLRFVARLVKWRVAFTSFAEAIADEVADLASEAAIAGSQATTPAASNTTQSALGAL